MEAKGWDATQKELKEPAAGGFRLETGGTDATQKELKDELLDEAHYVTLTLIDATQKELKAALCGRRTWCWLRDATQKELKVATLIVNELDVTFVTQDATQKELKAPSASGWAPVTAP